MTEYKINNAVVRIHGSIDRDRLQAATERFVKKTMKAKKEKAVKPDERKSA